MTKNQFRKLAENMNEGKFTYLIGRLIRQGQIRLIEANSNRIEFRINNVSLILDYEVLKVAYKKQSLKSKEFLNNTLMDYYNLIIEETGETFRIKSS